MTAAALRLDDVTVSYERHPAVHHLSGTFVAGSLSAVVGPNGAGKSTLLKAVAGLLPVESGRVERIGLARRDIAYLPQQADIDRRFPISVLDAVALGQWARSGVFGGLRPAAMEEARQAVAAVGLSGFERRPVATLSAGQFQRALFARMMQQQARLILLDEPFAAIDARTVLDLIAVVRRWHAERRTIVCVLHDLDMTREHFPETLLLARRPVAWGPTAEALNDANLRRARSMAEAWESDAAACARPEAA